jgi:hypothetical protein
LDSPTRKRCIEGRGIRLISPGRVRWKNQSAILSLLALRRPESQKKTGVGPALNRPSGVVASPIAHAHCSTVDTSSHRPGIARRIAVLPASRLLVVADPRMLPA